MAKIDTETLGKIAEQLARPQRIQDAAALAGTGLILPFATVRSRAARLEWRRMEMLNGEKSDEAQHAARNAAVLARREREIAADFARRSGPDVEIGEGEAILRGRVTRDGVPVAGVMLVVLGEGGKPARQTCTDREGRYAVAVPADTDLKIEIREEKKPVFRDKEAAAYPPGYSAARDIDIGQAQPPCDTPDTEPPAEVIQMPALVGQDIENATKTIKALGLEVGKVDEKPSDRHGIVLDQDPAAGVRVKPGAIVSLTVGTRKGWTADQVGDLKGRTLTDALKAMEEAKVALGSLTIVHDGTRTPTVRAATPTETGDALHLEVAVTGADASALNVAAVLLAHSEEGRALELNSVAKASRWLADAGITSLDGLSDAAAEDDAKLRARLSLEKAQKVAGQRKALVAVTSRLRKG